MQEQQWEVRVEIKEVAIVDKVTAIDRLLTALAYFGYSPYMSWDETQVCFKVVGENSIEEIKQ